MNVEKDKVATFHYHLTDAAGEVIDSSREAQPLTILVGHGALIPGVEQALIGRKVGDRFDVVVLPGEGYGERREDFTQRVPKKYFREGDRLKPGDTSMLGMQGGGHRQVTVIKVGSSVVDVDLNHPLAGKTLHFNVEITDVRDAMAEEIEHGHVHGAGGHHH